MKKSLKITILLIFLNIVVLGFHFFYWYLSSYNTTANISINTDTIVLEYGRLPIIDKSKVVSDKNTVFINNILNKTYDDVRKSVFIDRSKLNYEDEGVLLKVGEHELSFISRTNESKFYIKFNGKDSLTIPVSVVDTTPPAFTKTIDSLSTYQEVPIEENLTSYFEAEDLSDLTIYSINDDLVNYEVVGDYVVSIVAEDAWGNQSYENLVIHVKSPTISLNKSAVSISVGDTIQLAATVEGKSQKVKYTSSDTSIATVSDNGSIVAKNTGNCTVTATANGVSASVAVSVKTKKSSFLNTEGSVGQSAIDAGVAQLELLPDNLYNHFKNNGWRYIIVGGTMHAGEHGVTNLSSGSVIYAVTYWDGTNKVYINQNHLTSSLLHEFGHVIDCELGCTSCSAGFGDIYAAEKSAYLNVPGATKYTISTHYEFFGDAFESYIKYPSQLKKHCPMTYDYIASTVSGL